MFAERGIMFGAPFHTISRLYVKRNAVNHFATSHTVSVGVVDSGLKWYDVQTRVMD